MSVRFHVRLAASTLLLLTSAAAETLGHLGDVEVTVEDVRTVFASLSEGQREAIRQDAKLLEQVVRSHLVQRLVLQQALTERWQEQPRIVAKIERARDSVITESFLESQGEPPAEYPNDEELRAAYEREKETLRVPRSYRLAQIFIASSSPDHEAKLNRLQEKLRAENSDFAKLATEFSEEPVTASRGGELGWLSEAQIEASLRPQVEALKLNETTPAIQLKDGWHILKLLDARAAYTPTLEQARAQLTQQLRTEKLRANTQAYLARLLREHPLRLNEKALSKVLLDSTSSPSSP